LDVVVVLTTLEEGSASAGAAAPRPGAPASFNAIGVAVEPLDSATRSRLGLGADEGVRISRVESLAARQAGLAPGTVILQVGRTAVGSVAAFEAALKNYKSGDRVQ